jgi:hypothetical protein
LLELNLNQTRELLHPSLLTERGLSQHSSYWAGRESNCSGMGRFSSADCSHALREHLPVKGPWCVDEMDSEAYISQFSTDGSLLVGRFQVCDFAIIAKYESNHKL